MKNRKDLRKIAVCVSYAMFFLQAQGTERDQSIETQLRVNKLLANQLWQELNHAEIIVDTTPSIISKHSSSNLRNRHTQINYEPIGYSYEPAPKNKGLDEKHSMSISDEIHSSEDSASDEKSSVSNASNISDDKKIIVKEKNPLEDSLEKFVLEYRDRQRSCDLKVVKETLMSYVNNRRDFLRVAKFTFTISSELAEILYNGFSAK